ncbi:RAD51-associated protein 1 isoform X2 [Gouania willdenowi]|uniref:RAD51-associated protein 1 isoform X2 n=1 Tax=Gouania willdenowi TaxID=441366 RepID=UPI00105482DF|nr:RAD51-associated protein 1 isoform X2 [Gouania willdenowi]
MERPSRKTKTVDYSEAKYIDDDEDFACAKAPPTKKSREEVKPDRRKFSGKPSSQESNSKPPQNQKSRKPLEEKLLDRDLEAAITLSRLINAEDVTRHPPNTAAGLPLDENTDPSSLLRSNCSVDATVMGLDEITPEKQSQQKAEQPRKKDHGDEDEDYKPKLTPESESEDDFSGPSESDNDEEFTVTKVKKKEGTKKDKTKTTPAAKKEKQPFKPSKSKPQTVVRSPATVKALPTNPASSPTVTSSKPLLCPSPAGGRVPKWNPPAQVGKSPTSSHRPSDKSPGQGLRLGLSRLVRVKPLHPSVTSH